jgi:hypothetical protein
MRPRSVLRRRSAALLVVLIALVLGWNAAADGHDSLAPPASGHTYLPDEMWVHNHWIPFDERTLKRALGLHGRDLEAYLYNDHHTLATLARARGSSSEALADTLVSAWTGVDADQRAALRERTMRILTQGHLAQHMFFHVFHGVHLVRFSQQLFGISPGSFRRLHARGLSLVQIARRKGRSRELHTAIIRQVQTTLRTGEKQHEAWRAQSAAQLQRVHRQLSCWLRRPPPAHDPGNPYGKSLLQHGHHAAGWPATAAQRRTDEQRVEHARRRLTPSCWKPPPRWNRAEHGRS